MENNDKHEDIEERIVMTPMKKEKDLTLLRMERIKANDIASNDGSKHIAGGSHTGLVVNKQINDLNMDDSTPPELSLAFKVFLINTETQSHNQENRQIRFWFKSDVTESDKMFFGQQFFRDLVNPQNFPRDYIGFIMKLMKLMQIKYTNISAIEVELRLVQQLSEPPSRPTSKSGLLLSIGTDCSDDKYYYLRDVQSMPLPDIIQQCKPFTDREPVAPKPKLGSVSIDDNFFSSTTELTEHKVLELIESSYPNPISLAELSNTAQSTEEEVHFFIQELLSKNLIKALSDGVFTRVTQNDTEVKLVRQMPKVVRSEQPTIAIITAQYCEKLAVDSMIDNKDTYVRYKTEGESNVYTLGNIGVHRVVSTKLPAVGHSRAAMIAAGNTTTRLLGTFQCVEYVFLVGVGGGVPHYTDYSKHVRLGDVVVSVPPNSRDELTQQKQYIYIQCEKTKKSMEEPLNSSDSIDTFNYRFWCPLNQELQAIAQQIYEKANDSEDRVWEQYLHKGSEVLQELDQDFARPPPQTDKLYMSIGPKDVIEVQHPSPPNSDLYDPRSQGFPQIHFGAIGSGRMAVKDEQIRQDIASKYGIMAFDTEFDSVVESIFGNRKDKYIFLRGISDYKDGSRKKEWQPFAALSAAAYMKAILCALSPIDDN